ncbi:hypothetical protein C8J56DRAFT_1059184 [Mycena floridula]|nr:hypothetical protein C8J56DRAFT_1059184 [Mycena floridula]
MTDSPLQHSSKAPTIKELPPFTDDTLKDGLINAHRKLSDYFYKFDQSQYYTWAALLDPRISYESLRKDYRDDNDLLEGLEASRDSLKNHFEIWYATSFESTSSAIRRTGWLSFQTTFTSLY